jgi:hypothetical protein
MRIFALVYRILEIVAGSVNVSFEILSSEEAANEVIQMVISKRLDRLSTASIIENWLSADAPFQEDIAAVLRVDGLGRVKWKGRRVTHVAGRAHGIRRRLALEIELLKYV